MTKQEYEIFQEGDGNLYCNCCEKRLNWKTAVVLECNFMTGDYYEPGTVPEEESQGCFAFGPTCAKKLRRSR